MGVKTIPNCASLSFRHVSEAVAIAFANDRLRAAVPRSAVTTAKNTKWHRAVSPSPSCPDGIQYRFTGGTGRFRDARGSAHFTAVFSGIYPGSSFIGGTGAPFQVMAFYSIEGTVSLENADR